MYGVNYCMYRYYSTEKLNPGKHASKVPAVFTNLFFIRVAARFVPCLYLWIKGFNGKCLVFFP